MKPLFITLLFSALSLSAVAGSQYVTYLEQNWSDKEREYFYFADQGSRLLP